jgi:hypothetical protein
MDEAPSAEEDVVSFPIPVENRTSASTRGPESSDDLPGAIDGDNTLEDDLILRYAGYLELGANVHPTGLNSFSPSKGGSYCSWA